MNFACRENSNNKKVLLRERKRHTARRVASARYADWGGGGLPIPRSGGGGTHPQIQGGFPVPGPGGTPSQVRGRGVPHPRSRGAYSIPGWGEGVPHQDLGWGTPPGQTWDGVPPDLRWGPPRKCGQTHRLVSKHYLPSYYVRRR